MHHNNYLNVTIKRFSTSSLTLSCIMVISLRLSGISHQDCRLVYSNTQLSRPFFLYPPSYTHDISFWVHPASAPFKKQQLHAIVRFIAGNTVISLTCRDVYHPPNEMKVGYCYRLVYSPCDIPLSRSEITMMQLKVREEVEKRLIVTLR